MTVGAAIGPIGMGGRTDGAAAGATTGGGATG
jgi:hypothetical protein